MVFVVVDGIDRRLRVLRRIWKREALQKLNRTANESAGVLGQAG
jgi:hypothetical protein